MTSRQIALALAALALGAASVPAFAGSADVPAAKHHGVRKRALRTAPARPTAVAPARPSILVPRDDAASSLERRRRAFFATEPDEGEAGRPPPSAGVTLGGSGGLTPGMGFRF